MIDEKAIDCCIAAVNALLDKAKVSVSLIQEGDICYVDKTNLKTGDTEREFTGSLVECFAYLQGVFSGMEELVYLDYCEKQKKKNRMSSRCA